MVGGMDDFQGRVEVCTEALIYSTVCRVGWDNLDAQVVCRQLGFDGEWLNVLNMLYTSYRNSVISLLMLVSPSFIAQ